jgi:photosystem II stability/assembly factor-like uncharacterized protein
MARTKNPNSVRNVRRVVAGVSIGAFLLVDAVLITAALSNRGAPVSTAAPVTIASSLPPSTGNDRPSNLFPATRLLSASDGTVAWRSDVAVCPKTDAVIERSADGGQTWDGFDLGVEGGISGAIDLHAASGPTSASLIGLDKADCSPTWIETTNGGVEWSAYPDRAASAWFVDPANRALVHTPTGPLAAPCDQVVGLASLDPVFAAVLCSDGALYRTTDGGVSWAAKQVDGAIAIGSGDGAYVVATAADDPACIGVGITSVPESAEVPPSRVSSCVVTGNDSVNVAISANDQAIWVWAGTTVLRSLDDGVTWQP